MKIHHATLPAHDAPHVAAVLAEAVGGRAIPLPHPAGGFFVTAGDDDGTGIEVWPATMRAGTGEHHLAPGDEAMPARWPHHVYVSVDASKEDILGLFEREGWPADAVHNGPPGKGFELIRGWIEGHAVIEFATADMRAQYERFVGMIVGGGPPPGT